MATRLRDPDSRARSTIATRYRRKKNMGKPFNIMIMGASYGSLLATKLLLAGHNVKLVCLPAEAELTNKESTRLRLPGKGPEGPVEVDSRKPPVKLPADVPSAIKLAGCALHLLACRDPHDRP